MFKNDQGLVLIMTHFIVMLLMLVLLVSYWFSPIMVLLVLRLIDVALITLALLAVAAEDCPTTPASVPRLLNVRSNHAELHA